ncbi:MAG: DNA primase [Puniceicoccales bacterium]|jgi:DNA primase|nr:DNA primase [Puniceicoccales bacterium]
MASIRRSSIDALRERVDICDVVGAYVNLRRSGAYFRGLSPFNEERTPSFFVHPEKKYFKCYSSGKGGDVIDFLQFREQITFSEAVEFLAQKYAVPLEYEDGSGSSGGGSISKATLLAIHGHMAKIFQEYFFSATVPGDGARIYWTRRRKFSLESAEIYGIGLAPGDGHGAVDKLFRTFPPEALVASGLFFRRQEGDRIFPRFRGRLMIPIHDPLGRVIAFSGRALEGITAGEESAKYINSPETPIFHKGSVLFGLHLARTAVEGGGKPFLLTEGPLDCLRCWECGLKTAVAAQGTAITFQHLVLLRRHCLEVECLLDGDEAGQRAALRLIPMAFKAGIGVRLLRLPQGKDPDEFLLAEGSFGFRSLRKNAVSPMEFLVATHLPPETVGRSYAHRQEGIRQILSAIAEAGSRTMETDLLEQLTQLTGISPETLREDRNRWFPMEELSETSSGEQEKKGMPPKQSGEFLLHVFLRLDSWRPTIASLIPEDWLRADVPAEKLLNFFIGEWQNGLGPEEAMAALPEEDRGRACGFLFLEMEMDESDLRRQVERNMGRVHRNYVERELAKLPADGGADAARRRAELRRELLHPPHFGTIETTAEVHR